LDLSIPYGAIKSGSGGKESAESTILSIPYGAIKRPKMYLIDTNNNTFNSLWCD